MSMRDEFERLFPVPKDVEWTGFGYAPTKYSADQGYNRMWKVWQAARAQSAEPVAWWDGDTVDEETAFQFERDAIYKIPVYTHTNQPDSEQGGEWRSPSDLRSDIDVRVKLKDGSVIENCLSQSDGDFYWKGSGTEMFILEHEVVGWMPQPPKSKEGES